MKTNAVLLAVIVVWATNNYDFHDETGFYRLEVVKPVHYVHYAVEGITDPLVLTNSNLPAITNELKRFEFHEVPAKLERTPGTNTRPVNIHPGRTVLPISELPRRVK